jgi:hypothetical protein
MNLLNKLATCAAAGAALLAVSATGASAAIVCSGDVCWHTSEAYTYPPEAKVIVHEDSWKWGPSEHYTFREHEGRGYWRDNRWMVW